MNLWILQKPMAGGPSYEELRFREEARILGIALEVVSPDEIDLIVTRGGRCSNRQPCPRRTACPNMPDVPLSPLPRPDQP